MRARRNGQKRGSRPLPARPAGEGDPSAVRPAACQSDSPAGRAGRGLETSGFFDLAGQSDSPTAQGGGGLEGLCAGQLARQSRSPAGRAGRGLYRSRSLPPSGGEPGRREPLHHFSELLLCTLGEDAIADPRGEVSQASLVRGHGNELRGRRGEGRKEVPRRVPGHDADVGGGQTAMAEAGTAVRVVVVDLEALHGLQVVRAQMGADECDLRGRKLGLRQARLEVT